MTDKLFRKLQKLRATAQEKGQFVVDAAAFQLIEEPDSIDRQINLVGALHEVGTLRNVLAPYWAAYRADETGWIHRCIARLVSHDHDYWALAGLLACTGSAAVEEAQRLGFVMRAVRKYERFDLPDVHVASMSITHGSGMLVPLLELGWDVETGELVDCARARAVLLTTEESLSGSLVGEGDMAYFCRATLPHGSWRSVSLPFVIAAQSLVPR